MQILSGALLAALLVMLAIAVLIRTGTFSHKRTGETIQAREGLEVVAIAASAFGLLSPFIAFALRRAPSAPGGDTSQKLRVRHVASYCVCEAAAFFCLIAFGVSLPWWPLAAFLAPVGFMVAHFPRQS
jgi:hypothetical protein